MPLVTDLANEVAAETGLSQADALVRLNRRYKRMVAESRCYRKKVAVGTTVADTAFYALDVVEAYSFEVDGVPYGKARRPDIYAYGQGNLIWVGPSGSGLIVADADSSGAKGITLIPPPSTSGLAITSFAAVQPADLSLADTSLVIDADFQEALVEGAIASGRAREDEDAGGAQYFEQRFEAAIDGQRRRAISRFRGSGPAQIRVIGLNA